MQVVELQFPIGSGVKARRHDRHSAQQRDAAPDLDPLRVFLGGVPRASEYVEFPEDYADPVLAGSSWEVRNIVWTVTEDVEGDGEAVPIVVVQ